VKDLSMLALALGGVAVILILVLLVYNSRVRRKYEGRIQALIRVIEASQQLGSSTSLESVMPMVAESVKTLFHVDSVAVYLLDEESVEESVLRAKGVESPHGGAFTDFNPDVTQSYISRVMKERKPVMFGDFNAEATEERVISRERDFRSVMVSPLMFEGRAIGAMFASFHQPGKYNQDQLHFYYLLSTQVALAVRNAQLQEGLSALATRDSLSGLFTHGYFQEHLGKTIVKCKYANQPVALMILDMDFFKKVNDNYGHPQGDALLKQLGSVIKTVVRPTDTICRYGGDEFTVTMPDTNRISAVVVAEKIRQAVEEYEFVLGPNIVHITISGGVAAFPEDAETKKEIIEKADEAMYEAKHKGRNKICFAA
jgi:two-component system cell cycle response regulator